MRKIIFYKTGEKRWPRMGEWYIVQNWGNLTATMAVQDEKTIHYIIKPLEIEDVENKHKPGMIYDRRPMDDEIRKLERIYRGQAADKEQKFIDFNEFNSDWQDRRRPDELYGF